MARALAMMRERFRAHRRRLVDASRHPTSAPLTLSPERSRRSGALIPTGSGPRAAVLPGRNTAHTLALAGVAFTAATCATTFSAVKPEYGVALGALLLPFAGRPAWARLAKHPYVHALWLFFAYCAFQILYLHAHGAGSLQHLAAPTSKLVKLGLFGLATGVWLSLYPQMLRVVLHLMLAGFLAQTMRGIAMIGPATLLEGHVRLDIGYPTDLYPVNLGGMFFAMAVVGTLLAAVDASMRARSLIRGRWLAAGYLACSCFFLVCLVLAGSRGAWVAAGAAMLWVFPGYFRDCRRWTGDHGRHIRFWGAAGGLITVAVAAIAVNRLSGAGRLHDFVAIARDVLSGRVASVPMSSVGIRLHLWDYGAHLIAGQPFTGRGLASIAALIKGTDIRIGAFIPTHMHNAYMQAFVGLGLVGIALLAWGSLVLVRGARAGYVRGLVHPLTFWLLAGIVTVAAVANLFDSLVWRLTESRIPFELLLGCVVALALRGSSARQPGSSPTARHRMDMKTGAS